MLEDVEEVVGTQVHGLLQLESNLRSHAVGCVSCRMAALLSACQRVMTASSLAMRTLLPSSRWVGNVTE